MAFLRENFFMTPYKEIQISLPHNYPFKFPIPFAPKMFYKVVYDNDFEILSSFVPNEIS